MNFRCFKWIKIHLLILINCIILVDARSQKEPDELYDVKELIQNLEYTKSLEILGNIISKSDSSSDEFAEAIYYRGLCKHHLKNDEGANADYNLGFSLSNENFHAYYWTGKAIIQQRLLEYDSALQLYERALSQVRKDDELQIMLLAEIGNIYVTNQRPEKAKSYLLKANEQYEVQEFDSPYIKQIVYSALGEYYRLQRDYVTAERNLNAALNIAESILMDNHPTISELHRSLSHIYVGIEDNEKVIYHAKAHYELIIQNLEKGSFQLIRAENNLARSYMAIGRYDIAIDHQISIYNDMLSYFPNFDLGVQVVSMNLGISHYKLKNYDEAKDKLHRAIELGNKLYDKKSSGIAQAINYLSFAYEDDGDFETAEKLYTDAIDTNVLLQPGEKLSSRTESMDVLTLSHTLENRARMYVSKFIQYGGSEHLIKAKEDAELNLEILHRLQEAFSEDSRSTLSFELNYGYYIASDVNWHLYQLTGEEIYLEELVNYAERDKSDILRTNLNIEEAKEYAHIPDSLLRMEDSLRIDKEEIKARIITAERDETKASPWDSLLMIQEQLDAVVTNIKSTIDPSIGYQEKSLVNIQNDLKPDQAILEYMICDEIMMRIWITRNAINITRDSIDNLQERILTFRKEIIDQSEKFTTREQLYIELILGISTMEGINKITVIPDGALHYLPFELLGKGENYLFEDFVVTYANFLEEPTLRTNSNDKLLSYAPEFKSNNQLAFTDVLRDDLASIPGAFEEVNTIKQIFSGQSVVGEAATETNFKNNIEEYGILHMATHAIVDDSNPESSRLVFNVSGDTINDGYLHAYEIYNLNLNAQLVTLSACNTGYGKIDRGEGVMSLSWAFAYAGVPATVVSLWPASDKSAPELMKYFYQNLKNGQTKDLALNNARRQYLSKATGKARHPFYWGGFVLIGDNRPIVQESNIIMWLFTTLTVVIIGIVYFRNSRKRNL